MWLADTDTSTIIAANCLLTYSHLSLGGKSSWPTSLECTLLGLLFSPQFHFPTWYQTCIIEKVFIPAKGHGIDCDLLLELWKESEISKVKTASLRKIIGGKITTDYCYNKALAEPLDSKVLQRKWSRMCIKTSRSNVVKHMKATGGAASQAPLAMKQFWDTEIAEAMLLNREVFNSEMALAVHFGILREVLQWVSDIMTTT